jgi:UDP-N-acetyl-D-galactosamine dehydrogenase
MSGLPLAVALARKFETTGFDIDAGPDRRAARRPRPHPRGRQRSASRHSLADRRATQRTAGADVYIVTVPTPVDAANRPDLLGGVAATRMIAG